MSKKSIEKRNSEETSFINNLLTTLFSLISGICLILNVKSSIFVGVSFLLIIAYILHYIPAYRARKSKYYKFNRLVEGIANDMGILLSIITCMNFIDYSETYIYPIVGVILLGLLFTSVIVNMKKVGIKLNRNM